MNKEDLISMKNAAELIAIAAERHADYLRRQVDDWEDLPDHGDHAVIGESFSPLSQALADWRLLMTRLFPIIDDDTDELKKIVSSWD